MAKIFLDANIFIDIVEGRDLSLVETLEGDDLFVSSLSLEIWVYVYKRNIPLDKSQEIFDAFNFVDYTEAVARKAFVGPTCDFEDNIQLHSASDAGCHVFLTKDAGLLKLGYFGKSRIIDSLRV